MLENNKQLSKFGQKSVVHNASFRAAVEPRIKKISRCRRHRSLDNTKKLTKLQSTSSIHVSIRRSQSNQTKKSACEIYLVATLACCFTFDLSLSLNDSGPNFLTATNAGATSMTGRVNEAFQFSSALSFITINRISALASSNTAFTILCGLIQQL
jgi:hypothetical protein